MRPTVRTVRFATVALTSLLGGCGIFDFQLGAYAPGANPPSPTPPPPASAPLLVAVDATRAVAIAPADFGAPAASTLTTISAGTDDPAVADVASAPCGDGRACLAILGRAPGRAFIHVDATFDRTPYELDLDVSVESPDQLVPVAYGRSPAYGMLAGETLAFAFDALVGGTDGGLVPPIPTRGGLDVQPRFDGLFDVTALRAGRFSVAGRAAGLTAHADVDVIDEAEIRWIDWYDPDAGAVVATDADGQSRIILSTLGVGRTLRLTSFVTTSDGRMVEGALDERFRLASDSTALVDLRADAGVLTLRGLARGMASFSAIVNGRLATFVINVR